MSMRTPRGLTRQQVAQINALRQALRKVEVRVAKEALPAATRAAAEVLKRAVEREAPKDTGFMASKVDVVPVDAGEGVAFLLVQIGSKDFVGKTFYAAMVHYGWKTGRRHHRLKAGEKRNRRGERHLRENAQRRQIPGNPFMERAVDLDGGKAVAAMHRSFAEGLKAIVG